MGPVRHARSSLERHDASGVLLRLHEGDIHRWAARLGGPLVDPEEVVQEEVHILYVALTRARASIRLPESLEEWLRHRRLMPA